MTRDEMRREAQAVVRVFLEATKEAARSPDGMVRISGLVLVDAFDLIKAMHDALGLDKS